MIFSAGLYLLMFYALAEFAAGALAKSVRVKQHEFRTPADLVYQVRSGSRGGPFALELGSSVMNWRALANRGERDARRTSAGAMLATALLAQNPDFPVIDLSMEGALFGDYEAVVNLLEREYLRPSGIILQMDYRQFSETHAPEKFLSRKWLTPFAAEPQDLSLRAFSPNSQTMRPIDEFVNTRILYRSDLALTLSALVNVCEFAVNGGGLPREHSPDMDELRLRVASYYNSENLFPKGRAMKSLERLLDKLQEKRIPTLVFYTPVNRDFVGGDLNVPIYHYNLDYLERWFSFRYGDDHRLRLVSLEGLMADRLFIDHGHFSAEGNAELARLVFERWQIFAQDLRKGD